MKVARLCDVSDKDSFRLVGFFSLKVFFFSLVVADESFADLVTAQRSGACLTSISSVWWGLLCPDPLTVVTSHLDLIVFLFDIDKDSHSSCLSSPSNRAPWVHGQWSADTPQEAHQEYFAFFLERVGFCWAANVQWWETDVIFVWAKMCLQMWKVFQEALNQFNPFLL